MTQTLTITVHQKDRSDIIMVGERVLLSKKTIKWMGVGKFKTRYFLARIRKRKYKPAFIVKAVFNHNNEITEATLKPYNF